MSEKELTHYSLAIKPETMEHLKKIKAMLGHDTINGVIDSLFADPRKGAKTLGEYVDAMKSFSK